MSETSREMSLREWVHELRREQPNHLAVREFEALERERDSLAHRAEVLDEQNEALRHGLKINSESRLTVRNAELVDEKTALRKRNADLRAALTGPYATVIPRFRNRPGALCPTCDGTYEHTHERVKCSRCGREGLRENWPFRCCVAGALLQGEEEK